MGHIQAPPSLGPCHMVPGARKAAWMLGPAAGRSLAEEHWHSRVTETAHQRKKGKKEN